MGASEQPPLQQQIQNQTKVRGNIHNLQNTHWYLAAYLSLISPFPPLRQPVPTIGRSSLSLIQLTNSSPGLRPQNHMPMAHSHQNNMPGNRGPRPLDQVTCYKVSRPIVGRVMCSYSVIHLGGFNGRINNHARVLLSTRLNTLSLRKLFSHMYYGFHFRLRTYLS